MHEKKPSARGVVDSIAALRAARYMTRGPGQFERRGKKATPAPTLEKLRKDVDTVAKKAAKKKKQKAKGGPR